MWRIPETSLQVLGDVDGLDVLEYGCGAAQWSMALAARGARVTGLDISVRQLTHARRADAARLSTVGLVCASATTSPFPDASFDLVFCDHGAMSFCDPAESVPECARLLRDGGRLVFCVGTQLVYLTWNAATGRQTRHLHEPWSTRRLFHSEGGTVDLVWSHGEWIHELRANGLVVDDLVELIAPVGAAPTHDFVPHSWARRWPAEEIWCATRLPRESTARASRMERSE